MIVIECDGYILGEVSGQPMFAENGEPLLVEGGSCQLKDLGNKMAILNIQLGQTGLVGVQPRFDYMLTTDSVLEVLAEGYLNHSVDHGYSFSQGDLVCVVTQETPTARQMSGIYQVDHTPGEWSLVPTTSSMLLTAAQYTTVGGAAAEAITIAGVAATDLAFVQVVNNGTANVTVLEAACTADTLTVTFSGNPGADAVINYQILRP